MRLASFQTATRALVMPALPRLAAAHPDLRVELIELEAEESLPVLARGGVDIAIAEEYEHAPRPHQPELHRDDLEPDELVLTLPRGLLARRRRRWRWARCASCRGRPRGPAPTTPTCSCARAGRPASSRSSTTASTTSGCCSTSWRSPASAALLPSLGHPEEDPRVEVRPLAGGPISRALFVATRAADRARPSTAAVVDAIRGQAPSQAACCLAGGFHKSVRHPWFHRCVDLRHDGWAIRSQPPGRRDLGSTELWERSLARSQRRREYAALRRTPAYRKKRALVSAALMTATVLAPAHDAARAQGTEVTDASAGMLKLGSRGPEVAAMQRALGISADGIFGHQTKRAVTAFQAAHGLEVDGIVGPITRGALVGGGGGGGGGVRSKLPPATTIAVQRALGISADGVFGHQTRRAVKAFQAAHGLEVDGVVGPVTLGALGISGAAAPVGGGGGAAGAVAAARTQAGKPYALGGVGPSSFDCSGLTQWAMAQVGIQLPRTSFEQASAGVHVDRAAIQAGDLVFFDANGPGRVARRHRHRPDDRDLRHHARRARALDGRLLLGRALLRRAPRRLTRAPALHQRRQLLAQEREELARLLEPAARPACRGRGPRRPRPSPAPSGAASRSRWA